MHSDFDIPTFKIVLFGDSGVGKTSIVQYFESSCFDPAIDSTVGASFIAHEMSTQSGRLTLHIWDTAGQERYRSLVPTYARGACCAMIVFDLSDRPSFEHLDHWVSEFDGFGSPGYIIYIIGNKNDLAPEVSAEEAAGWASGHAFAIFNVSAKTGDGINAMFQEIAEDIGRKRPASVRQFEFGDPEAEGRREKSCC